MNTRQMLERRTALVTQLREMQDTADSNANGEMTADQAAAFEKLKAALVELESAMTRRSVIEDAERRMTGQPIGGTGDRRLDDDISRRYSWTRALAGAAGLKTDDSYEREVSAELARRSGREPGGFFAPLLALNPPMERRVTTTTAPNGFPGGNVIGTYLDPSLFIPPLYAALTIRKAGARVISGLVSNVDIPQQSQSVVGSWVAENTPLTFTDPGFTRVSLRPKHYGAITEFSRNMLLQSTPDIEALLRADMTNVLARGLDAAAIAGTGTANDPVGILNQTGIGTVSMGTNGAPLTWLLSAIRACGLLRCKYRKFPMSHWVLSKTIAICWPAIHSTPPHLRRAVAPRALAVIFPRYSMEISLTCCSACGRRSIFW
jgi:HK97 family phage major capsid protein